MSLMTEYCTLHLRGERTGEDEYGEPIFSPPRDVDSPCWVEPAGTAEDMALANQLTFSYVAYLPLSTQVSAVDALTWDGIRFEVDGEPLKQPGGFIVEGFWRVQLKKVTG